MKVLVLGGTGLIGSAITARLSARGHTVIIASRHPPATVPDRLAVDLAKADEAFWLAHLKGVDAVVNCAGLLQDAPGESTAAVHHTGITSLFKACETLRVGKVIHFSAMGVNRATPSNFSKSKRAGDEALVRLDLDWVILRPSLVMGRAAYGGSALMRGLAALPICPVMPANAPLQVIWLEDVVAAVEHFLSPDAAGKQIVELAGPDTFSFEDVVATLRKWMRWPAASTIRLPAGLAKLTYWAGDLISLLGWRPPVRSTAQKEMTRGAVVDPTAVQMPLTATPLRQALAREPASVQERWFARMYFVKPLIFAVLALFWISTALVSLGPGWDHGIGLMREGGVEGTAATLTVIAGALADLCIGLAIAYRPTSRLGLYAAIVISFAYAIIGTILVPRLWADPLGPMLKIWPIIVLHLVALAIREDR
ncbi:SDR family oxidoreductase [Bradyrhizobium sp. LHD-71]|uniref:SDR family oxidoreductase n=1 Tax=Bradyrhizobium sp. LHD-71 TaxID=3072141 RepID=UPI00280D4078|nr:SDR family oxidoreductase [Bradyrhizobium sp. LHD-71]MDQ8729312.1 SDR family oxidoreductase [Bradyrhizobium sp. LHD-71]